MEPPKLILKDFKRSMKKLRDFLKLKTFEDLYTIFQRFFQDLCCFFTVLNNLNIFIKDFAIIFTKIFVDLQSLKIKHPWLNMFDNLYKVFWGSFATILLRWTSERSLKIFSYFQPLGLCSSTISLDHCSLI